ncbi:MAG TPA: hypothetical protein VFS13_05845 [Steroidobacteraceae bacterium]|nr:hypothetical protein [Steroidobacteraceae bacterium]
MIAFDQWRDAPIFHNSLTVPHHAAVHAADQVAEANKAREAQTPRGKPRTN